MITPVRFHRLAAGSAAVALAISAAALVPTVQAQAPAPPAPLTAGDAKEFEAAAALFNEGKWEEAMKAFEAFRNKYKMLSPRSLDAHFMLSICYLQQKPRPLTKEAVSTLRLLLADKKFVDPASREQAQLLIAKAYTMEGAGMPNETDVQKGAQVKVFEEAIKEYGVFISTYPASKSGDTAYFLTGTLQLSSEKYEDAIKSFGTVFQKYPNSPLRMSALMNIGKTYMSQGYGLMGPKKGKEATEADVKAGLNILENNAIKSLTAAYQQSGDIAIQNEAVYYIGQIQLTRSQHATGADEAATKKAQTELLDNSLNAFRAVRSREEVLVAQDEKINALKKAIQLLKPGTPEYLPSKSYYENLIDLEAEKKTKFETEQDQFLGARLAIARIFLFLKKPDECRVLLRYLQGQKEILAKEKDAQASIAALLCLTYVEQKNLKMSLELYEAFRKEFKGHPEGDNLPLLLANLLLENGQPERAEEIVAQGKDDYAPREASAGVAASTGWRFATDANQILIASYLQRGQYDKAQKLCEDVLSSSPKPEVEVQVLFLKGTVQRAMASNSGKGSLADEAAATFQVVRDKFPETTQAEDAWSEQLGIWAGRDPKKAQPELEKFLSQFSGGTGKSPNTKNNVPIAQFRLGQVLDALGKKDESIKAYQAVYEKYPESEPAPGAFFKIFDIYKERKDYTQCAKLMDEFIQKYPEHENVYYAFSNMAEFLFSGSLNTKVGKDGKPLPPAPPTLQDTEAGEKKLLDYVDYELSKNLKEKRGDGSLLKIADRWTERLSKLPSYVTQSNEQKQIWQRGIEGITTAVEKMIKNYPNGEKLGDGLERLVAAQQQLLKAQVIDEAKGEAYLRKLANEAPTPQAKAKLMFATAAFVQDKDPKKAASIRSEGFKSVEGGAAPKPEEGKEAPPVFTANDWDRYLSDLTEAKKFDDVTKGIAQIRSEYKAPKEGEEAPTHVENALAVALYWEAKVLDEQGKKVDAGTKYAELAKKYPNSPKVLEADYGIIAGQLEQRNFSDPTFPDRLKKIITKSTTMKSFELPAKALFAIAQIEEASKDFDNAAKTYRKIHTSYESVPDMAAKGLWEAARILEGQARGTIAVKTQKELQAAAQEKAAKAKAAREKVEAEKKKAEAEAAKADGKTADPKSGTPKATDAKQPDAKAPGVAKTEAAAQKK